MKLIPKIFTRLKASNPETLNTVRIDNLEAFNEHQTRLETTASTRRTYESNLLRNDAQPFNVQGHCRVCGNDSLFSVDYTAAYVTNDQGILQPNWRETLICEGCGQNNRVRASADYFKNVLHPVSSSKIYVTEQLTPFYSWIKGVFPQTIGSEFLDDKFTSGDSHNGLRHEDLTRLSFQDRSLDFILSFDVFEHIPDYRKALSECYRCLDDRGVMLFSVPFLSSNYDTLIRARISDDGEIMHMQTPEYHGNPTKPGEGSLCFYHFGWDLLDTLKQTGFKQAYIETIYSQPFAYLGQEQILILARKDNVP